jgi:hypothetical protein
MADRNRSSLFRERWMNKASSDYRLHCHYYLLCHHLPKTQLRNIDSELLLVTELEIIMKIGYQLFA